MQYPSTVQLLLCNILTRTTIGLSNIINNMRKKDTQYALQVSWQTKRKQLPAAVMHAAPFFSFLLHV
jgi:hypothetical protein